MFDVDYELKVLKRIVEIDTDVMKKTGYVECARILREEAEAIGLGVEVYDSKDYAGDGISRPNLVATLDVGADKTLGIVTHYDVVPPGEGWTYPPFKLTVVDDRAYGRGASDDKGAIATALGALKRVSDKSKFNVKLMMSPDEEVGGKFGIGYLVNEVKVQCDEVIILDGGPEAVSIGASGIIRGTIRVKGTQGHAAYPHLYSNPIYGLITFLDKFRRFSEVRAKKISRIPAPPGSPLPYLWGRFSITVLRAGEKENVIPGEAIAKFDLRVLPDEPVEEALTELKAFFLAVKQETQVDAELVDIRGGGNWCIDPEHPMAKAFQKAASKAYGELIPIAGEFGGNDGRYFAPKGIPTISYGPLRRGTNYHGVDEHVYLKDVKCVRDALVYYLTEDF
ncbi:MAG: hypothetical protein DRJ26_02790 [Candidatus Methanomethylicota archaeon]|uniref:Peptidase M20 dimerisation domain-containing protein n=1 Tax=Thermoproteota archaeon TaxID=2056631 RepID=A0A497F335_9CREN|nr:MAG: hypothetical protein DRJ26_02790 [Candidatus Verstraetearchaeota archaeon]